MQQQRPPKQQQKQQQPEQPRRQQQTQPKQPKQQAKKAQSKQIKQPKQIKIQRLGVICHPARPQVQELLENILPWACARNIQLLLSRRMAEAMQQPQLTASHEEMAEKAEIIVVLGGDGSILEATRFFAPYGTPVAGINVGRLGFLTLGDSAQAMGILERLASGKFRVENRLMLRAVVHRNDQPVYRGIALNDVVILKHPLLRVIDVHVEVSGTPVTSFRGDGVIFSTPTGSTAYSLSAGGPLIPPWVNVFVVCPLNSHTLNARPVVTSDQDLIQARLECTHSEAELVFDGQEGFPLENGDRIEVSRNHDCARIIVLSPRNFFRLLRKKMNWGA